MKAAFEAVIQACNEIDMVAAKEGTSNFVMPHVKQAFINLAEAYLMEAKWCSEKYVPSYEEYKNNGVVSSFGPLQITSFLGPGNLATEEVFDWISTNPKIIEAVSLIGRLMDDVATHEDINEEHLNNPYDIPKSLLDYVVNWARVSEVVYENLQDRFTNGESLKHYIVVLCAKFDGDMDILCLFMD
ncbi:probable sesquiterpene synthase [Neltuma alba]|uniref:probable sesquiterpene synthase n=1 Tax=Neltuma alba TaxID=207710 RepID=UPI0010A4782C|nr:probable sesquiterpene synthase [Prosopis alba]